MTNELTLYPWILRLLFVQFLWFVLRDGPGPSQGTGGSRTTPLPQGTGGSRTTPLPQGTGHSRTTPLPQIRGDSKTTPLPSYLQTTGPRESEVEGGRGEDQPVSGHVGTREEGGSSSGMTIQQGPSRTLPVGGRDRSAGQ